MPLTISFDSLSGDINADNSGNYNLVVFGSITAIRGRQNWWCMVETTPKKPLPGSRTNWMPLGFVSGVRYRKAKEIKATGHALNSARAAQKFLYRKNRLI